MPGDEGASAAMDWATSGVAGALRRPQRASSVRLHLSSRWLVPLVLVLAALAIAALQEIAGVRITGYGRSQDGGFAVLALRDFLTAQADGAAFPRWAAAANGGLGAPIFFFYPPGAYAFASMLAHLLPGDITEVGILAATETCFRALSVLTCAVWLRNRVDWSSATLGGACYALMPYVALINPQVRLAFADTAAGVVLPLAFLAVDLGRGRILRTIGLVAPAMALLVVTHLPLAVLSGGLCVAYAGFCGLSVLDRVQRAASASAGVLLGLALAGVTLVPALLLQPFSQMETLDAPFYDPTTHFMFTMRFSSAMDVVLHGAMLVPVLCGVLAWVWTGRRGVSGLLPILATLALAAFLLQPLSRPVWDHIPFLRHVQFPFRLGLPISLLGAAALGVAVAARPGRLRPALLLGGLALSAALSVAAWRLGDDGRPESLRTGHAVAYAETAEYISGAARVHPEWQELRPHGVAPLRAEAARLSGCGDGRMPAYTVTSTSLTVTPPDGCEGRVVLPHFFFPGWAPKGDAPPLEPDPVSGLIAVTPIRQGPLLYERQPLAEEEMGVDLSMFALGLWAIVLTLELAAAPERQTGGFRRPALAVLATRRRR